MFMLSEAFPILLSFLFLLTIIDLGIKSSSMIIELD